MISEIAVAVIVPDREIRDLICLNLRFESIHTIPYASVDDFIKSDPEVSLAIIDLTAEPDPKKTLKSIRGEFGDDFAIVVLTDQSMLPLEKGREIILNYTNGRKRFDAPVLVGKVKEIIESSKQEPLSHPLTGLPSGTVVEKHIASLLASGRNFAMVVTDMDNMKAFNQRFGYAVGDALLTKLVKLITHELNQYPSELNFIGHRGEDDFIIITGSDLAVSVAEQIIDGFDTMIEEFFSEEDSKRGFFVVKDRRGNDVKFPVTTLSLVIINSEGRQYYHPSELFDAAEELMLSVKERGIHQSYCAVDRGSKKNEPRDIFI